MKIKSILGAALLSSSMCLVACGGESGSSGSSSDPFPYLSSCKISNNVIYVDSIGPGCKVKTSKLNKGQTFSLSCTAAFKTSQGTVIRPAEFDVRASKSADIDSVTNDIKTFRNFSYSCKETKLPSIDDYIK